MKNRTHALSKVGQPRREYQCSVTNENLNLRTSLGRTTKARMSVFSGF